MKRFPKVQALADANEDEVLAHWSGLGYYSRARNLHQAARMIRDGYHGRFPRMIDEVMALPGIGRSTAGAILSISRGDCYAILDGNVKRVLTRFHAVEGWPGKREVEQRLWQLAEVHTPEQRIADYTQAIMDLGATLCTRSRPRCGECPMKADCEALRQERVADFPGKKARKELPLKFVVMPVVVNDKGEVLLHKRPPTGIWGGLWSLPECPDMSALQSWQEKYFGKKSDVLPMEPLKHIFSHFRLDIQPQFIRVEAETQRVADDEGTVWQPLSALDALGVPAPVRRILEGPFPRSNKKDL